MDAQPVRAPATAPHAPIVRPALVYVALFGAVGAYFPYINLYLRSIGLSLETIGLLAALGAAVSLVAAPAWGAVADRAPNVRRPLLEAGIGATAAALVLAIAREPLAVAIAIAALAAAGAGIGPMLDSRTIELLGADRDRFGRARAWGSVAFIVVSLVVGVLIDRTGPHGLFLVYVPLLALASLVAWGLLGGPRGPVRRTFAAGRFGGLVQILGLPRLGLFFGGSVLLWTSVSAVTTFVSIHLVGLGGQNREVGLLWALGAFVEVPLMFAFPVLARRLGAERLLVFGGIAFAARSLGWALATDPLLLVAAAPLGGIGFGLFYVGTVGYVSRAVPAGSQATAQGIFSGTAFSIGAILGSTLGGQLAAAITIRGLFGVSAFGAAVAALVIWRAIMSDRSTAA